jgi:hypothetical protein
MLQRLSEFLASISWPFYARIAQHEAIREVVESVPLTDLRWPLMYVSMMKPSNQNQGHFELLDAPSHHNMLLKANSPPAWKDTWPIWMPYIGMFLNSMVLVSRQYNT